MQISYSTNSKSILSNHFRYKIDLRKKLYLVNFIRPLFLTVNLEPRLKRHNEQILQRYESRVVCNECFQTANTSVTSVTKNQTITASRLSKGRSYPTLSIDPKVLLCKIVVVSS